jgi:hypothetical protein
VSAPRRCETCGSAQGEDQRYCLACGARQGPPGPLLDALLARVAESSARGQPAAVPDPAPASPARPARSGARLPGRRVSALLVLVFLGFGALLGSAGSDPGRLAAAAGPLKLVLPSHAASTTPAGGSAESRQPASEPPEAQSEATPAASSGESGGSAPAATNGAGKSEEEQPASRKPKAARAAKLTDIGHVFLIVLSNEPYAEEFGPETSAHYLSWTLEGKGELLARYDAVAHEQLANGIALLSGQGPTPQTAANCPTYSPLSPASPGADGQALGQGCVYPASVATLPGQLSAKHESWRAYVQGIDEPGASAPACAHPAPGTADQYAAGGPYATSRNPFVYFESIAGTADCATGDVGLSALAADLAKPASKAPSFSYIVPDRCHDGDGVPCAPGAPAGPADAESFLRKVVPEIMASKAYKANGLIVITTDEAPSGGEYADSSSCCGQPAYPNMAASAGGRGVGGGSVGALLLSPLIKGGTSSQEPYNHYSLLRSIEDVFGLDHLGYAGLPSVKSLSSALLNAPAKGQ